MNQLNTFNFEGKHPVQTVPFRGKPAFVARDIAKCLGYNWNGMKTIGHVPEKWRGLEEGFLNNRVESDSTPLHKCNKRLLLTEEGVYFFVCRSDKPKARPFQEWLAGEVLPAIRKTGTYSVPEAPKVESTKIKTINATEFNGRISGTHAWVYVAESFLARYAKDCEFIEVNIGDLFRCGISEWPDVQRHKESVPLLSG